MLSRFATRTWFDVRHEFPRPQSEVELAANITAGVTLTGHVDTLSIIREQRRFHLADLKTGRLDADYLDRMLNNEDYSPDECPACNGQGHCHGIHDDHIKKCPECGGSGKLQD